MRHRKIRANSFDCNLVQISELDGNGNDIRTSYEVTESDGSVAGLFGSLKEAESFFKLLCHINQGQAG